MDPGIDILVYERTEPNQPPALAKVLPLRGRTELGRQETNAEALYTCAWREEGQYWRVVVARGNEQTIGRHHAFIDPLPDGILQLVNTSTKSTVHVENGPALSRNSPCSIDVPSGGLLLRLGSSRIVRLQRRHDAESELNALPQMTVRPEEFSLDIGTSSLMPQMSLGASVPEIGDDSVVGWLQTVLALLQNAANSPDFLPRAARAVVDLAGMDTGRVLLRERGAWPEAALAVREGPPISETGWHPSQRVMERVTGEKKTFWEMPRLVPGGSMYGIQAVIAAPILDPRGEVVGVLYGDRRAVDARPITRIQAMLVELLACGLAARLARQKEEQAALRFEQFFTPQLARILVAQPELLVGRNAEVTVLFCDLRDFSRFSHQFAADIVVAWISDVMGAMSDCIIEHHGVVVDYIGDEVMAMWGAPDARPDHAQLACRAAEAMLARLPELNARWLPRLGEPIGLGIGLNTGPAHVGNVGTLRKFKYGPLGNTVNLASRIQGVTRHLRTRLLFARDTFDKLEPEHQLRARRACTVRVIGIDKPVELFELAGPNHPAGPDWKEAYESALSEFEAGHFRQAARSLQPLIVEAVNDGPSIMLLSRAVQGLAHGPMAAHPVWELPSK